MRIQLSTSTPAVSGSMLAVIGTWDPLLRAHQELFRELARRGTEAGLTPVVIILYPSPARLVNPDPEICLEYTDLKARIALIRECAGVHVLTVRMAKCDLDASSGSFFDLIGSHMRLREIWLGANQSLGRCKQGSAPAIAALARRRKISLRRLDVSKKTGVGGKALRLLGAGKLREAIQCVGHAPIWGRPRSGVLRLNWPPGEYLATPIMSPSITTISTPVPITVKIASTGRGGVLKWPAQDVEWLSFLAGPADPSATPGGPKANNRRAVPRLTSLK